MELPYSVDVFILCAGICIVLLLAWKIMLDIMDYSAKVATQKQWLELIPVIDTTLQRILGKEEDVGARMSAAAE